MFGHRLDAHHLDDDLKCVDVRIVCGIDDIQNFVFRLPNGVMYVQLGFVFHEISLDILCNWKKRILFFKILNFFDMLNPIFSSFIEFEISLNLNIY